MTVLFTDIVGSTELAAKLGDGPWRELLDLHSAEVRAQLRAHGGREIKGTGDGVLATFSSPGDAIACAVVLVEGAHQQGLSLRAGLHTGEVERWGSDLAGIGVHFAARIVALAEPDEILVSSTVKDLVAGSPWFFAPRGAHALKGIAGRRRLFAVSARNEDAEQRSRRRRESAVPAAARAPAGRKRISVLLVDDHPLWRETLRGLLDQSGLARVVGEAGDGAEAVEAAARLEPDVVLMDVDLPDESGITATATLVAARPETKVLMLSSLKERGQVLDALRAGASGYLLKTARGAEVADAISRVARGELAFPPELSSFVLAELRNPKRAHETAGGVAALTPSEQRVLALMAGGRSNQAIAEELVVSAKTVETHVAAIFTKLGLEPDPDQHRRVQAVVAFLHETERPTGR